MIPSGCIIVPNLAIGTYDQIFQHKNVTHLAKGMCDLFGMSDKWFWTYNAWPPIDMTFRYKLHQPLITNRCC